MTNIQEIWLTINSYPKYEISNTGKVRNKITKRLKSIRPNTSGYASTNLVISKYNIKRIEIHRLVALHFIPNTNNKPQVNHIDCNRMNPHISNLEWVTASENQIHAYRVGVKVSRFIGDRNPTCKLTPKQALEVFNHLGSYKQIGELYGISQQNIRHIKKGRAWGHVTGCPDLTVKRY